MIAPFILAASVCAAEMTFESTPPGRLPANLTASVNHDHKPGNWIVQPDPTAPSPPHVLVQTDEDKTSARFPVCVVKDFAAKNVDITVRFKPLSGTKDQAGGIVWRYRDADNYYIVRANALENNVVLYKMENGKRSDLKPVGAGAAAYGKRVQVRPREWSTLRVVVQESLFTVFFNGEELFTAFDETFLGSGQIGVWTKADSVTAFDNLDYKPVHP